MSERRPAPPYGGRVREPFLQLPCAVIDEVMPTLRDTEFRILLIVFRQTVGFRGADGTCKERDWLSHTQLRQRTGRASEAVSSAVDVLVRRRLVRVQDEHGNEIVTSKDRRRNRGRLYYALGPYFIHVGHRPLKTEFGKAKTTTEALMPIYSPFRFTGGSASCGVGEAAATAGIDRRSILEHAIRDRLANLRS